MVSKQDWLGGKDCTPDYFGNLSHLRVQFFQNRAVNEEWDIGWFGTVIDRLFNPVKHLFSLGTMQNLQSCQFNLDLAAPHHHIPGCPDHVSLVNLRESPFSCFNKSGGVFSPALINKCEDCRS